jgi:glycosyltransferase involved in cell wall biosynthesis
MNDLLNSRKEKRFFREEIRSLPSLGRSEKSLPTVAVSFLLPAYRYGASLERTVLLVRDYLKSQFADRFEIIVIPNGSRDSDDRTYEVAEALASRFQEVKVVPHRSPRGKGAALRTGYSQSAGEWIFFMDVDLPYDIAFFSKAARLLTEGFDFITGNRRLSDSRFDIPVSVLPMAYRRHQIGLTFNRVVRWLFPITVTDTQAGIKAMSQRMAEVAFSNQICPGFFFDVEFFLCCKGSHFRNAEIPVTLFLNSEKSTVQLLRESILGVIWLGKIFSKFKRGGYALDRRARRSFFLEGQKS